MMIGAVQKNSNGKPAMSCLKGVQLSAKFSKLAVRRLQLKRENI
jgi:hypothetical protein